MKRKLIFLPKQLARPEKQTELAAVEAKSLRQQLDKLSSESRKHYAAQLRLERKHRKLTQRLPAESAAPS